MDTKKENLLAKDTACEDGGESRQENLQVEGVVDDEKTEGVLNEEQPEIIAMEREKSEFLDKNLTLEHTDDTKSRLTVQAVVILITSVIRALAYDIFIVPNKIAPGGVAGLASIFYNLNSKWSVGFTTALMNVPLFILAFLYINKKFAISTMIAVVITSVFTDVLAKYITVVFTGDLFVASLVGGMLNGVALGFLLKINSSTGGTDIMGLLIQNKLPDVKITWIIFIFNAAVTALSGIVFKSLELIIYSLISVFAMSFAGDFVQKGFVSTVEFKIFTQKQYERTFADYVINVLGHSITTVPATGLYNGEAVCFLVCIVRKRQATALKKMILNTDPEVFFYVSSVSSILGKGFYDNATPKTKSSIKSRKAAKLEKADLKKASKSDKPA